MRTTVAVLLAACAVAASPARADAPPIAVTRCSVTAQPVEQNPKLGFRIAQVDGVTIDYTNDGAAAATEIRFRIRYAGITKTVVDRGTFAPGVKHSREFTSFDAAFTGPSADCTPIAATFADGTRWPADGPAGAATPRP